MCKFLDMRHNFHICDFENAIICGKIRDMRVLAKYVIAYNQHPSTQWLKGYSVPADTTVSHLQSDKQLVNAKNKQKYS